MRIPLQYLFRGVRRPRIDDDVFELQNPATLATINIGTVTEGTFSFGHNLREAGLVFSDIAGISYAPLSGGFSLSSDVDVNYLMHFQVPA